MFHEKHLNKQVIHKLPTIVYKYLYLEAIITYLSLFSYNYASLGHRILFPSKQKQRIICFTRNTFLIYFQKIYPNQFIKNFTGLI